MRNDKGVKWRFQLFDKTTIFSVIQHTQTHMVIFTYPQNPICFSHYVFVRNPSPSHTHTLTSPTLPTLPKQKAGSFVRIKARVLNPHRTPSSSSEPHSEKPFPNENSSYLITNLLASSFVKTYIDFSYLISQTTLVPSFSLYC